MTKSCKDRLQQLGEDIRCTAQAEGNSPAMEISDTCDGLPRLRLIGRHPTFGGISSGGKQL